MLLKTKLDNMKSFLKNDNVLAKLEERYCYAKDALNINSNYKIPDLVVFVETIEEVQKIVSYANQHEIPIVSRGAGTNMVGACVCNKGGIILNFSKMNKILEINPTNMLVRVQPGVVLGDLKKEVEKYSLFYPPDPSSYSVATVGGSIAQSSGGAMSFKYGTTKDYVLSLKVVTADGSLIQLGAETSKNSSGYHLTQLLVGSEGTLGIIVEATLKIIPKPIKESVLLAHFSSYADAIEVVNKIVENQVFPAAIDFMDKNSISTVEDYIHCGLNLDAKCLILIQLDGSEQSIDEQIRKTKQILDDSNAIDIMIPASKDEAEEIWKARRSSFSAATRLAPDVVSDDVIVPRARLIEMLNKIDEISQKYSLKVCTVGHIGDGNLHPQFVLNLENELEARNYLSAKAELYSYVKDLEGAISAEHGIGIEKLSYLENTIDSGALEYMKQIKKIFDPKNILNPGKIFNL